MIQKKTQYLLNQSKAKEHILTEELEPQPGSGFLSGWYLIESLLYAFFISESEAPDSNPRMLNGSNI